MPFDLVVRPAIFVRVARPPRSSHTRAHFRERLTISRSDPPEHAPRSVVRA